MKKAIFLDIETTGFSRDWDCIIELAAICVNLETGKTIDEFHSYLKPNKKIPAKITELTGIDDFTVANAPDEKEVLLNFGVWVADAECKTLIAHNGKSFDFPFISKRCEKYNIPLDFCDGTYEQIDTLALARQLKKKGDLVAENLKQPTLAAFYNIDYTAHCALDDTKALVQLYFKMTGTTPNITEKRAALGF